MVTSYTTDNPNRLNISKIVTENQRSYAELHGYQYLEIPDNQAKNCSKKNRFFYLY